MHTRLRTWATILLASGGMAVGACGGHSNDRAATAGGDVAYPSAAATNVPAATPASPTVDAQAPAHHSKIAGAVVGAAVGHVLGGHAVAGAAAGALIQHHRNKTP